MPTGLTGSRVSIRAPALLDVVDEAIDRRRARGDDPVASVRVSVISPAHGAALSLPEVLDAVEPQIGDCRFSRHARRSATPCPARMHTLTAGFGMALTTWPRP